MILYSFSCLHLLWTDILPILVSFHYFCVLFIYDFSEITKLPLRFKYVKTLWSYDERWQCKLKTLYCFVFFKLWKPIIGMRGEWKNVNWELLISSEIDVYDVNFLSVSRASLVHKTEWGVHMTHKCVCCVFHSSVTLWVN